MTQPRYLPPETEAGAVALQEASPPRPSRRFDWRFVKDSVVVGLGSTIARVLGLLFSILLARFLTQDDFAFVRYSITLAGVLTIVSASYPASIGRFLAAHPDDRETRDRYYTNGLAGFGGVLALSLLVAVPVLTVLNAFDVGTLLSIVGLSGFFIYISIMRGLSSSWKMGLSYITTNLALIAALLLLLGVFGWQTATVALAIYGLANLVPPLALEVVRPSPLSFRPALLSRATIAELFRFAGPMILSNASYTLWFGMDMLLVENLKPGDTANYAAAKTLSSAFIFVPTAISLVIMPRVAAMDLRKSLRYCGAGVAAGLGLSLVGVLIVAVAGGLVIELTFGKEYSGAYLPLLILGFGMTVYSIYLVLEGYLVGRGRPSLHAQAMTLAMVTAGAIGFWLTPTMGGVGASLGFSLGAALGCVLLGFSTWRFIKVESRKSKVESN